MAVQSCPRLVRIYAKLSDSQWIRGSESEAGVPRWGARRGSAAVIGACKEAFAGAGGPTGSGVTSAISAAAVAAAEAEAQAAELEQRAERAARSRRPYYLSNYLRKNGSTSPASSDSTCSSAYRIAARLPGQRSILQHT